MSPTNATVAETDSVAEQIRDVNGSPPNSDAEKGELFRKDVARTLRVATRIVKRFDGILRPERVKHGRQWCNGYKKSTDKTNEIAACMKNCETLREKREIEPVNGEFLVLKLKDDLSGDFEIFDLCEADKSAKFFTASKIIKRHKSGSAIRKALADGTLRSIKIFAHNTAYVYVISERNFDSWKHGFEKVDGRPSSKWTTQAKLIAFAGAETISERRNLAARIKLLDKKFENEGKKYTQTRRIKVRNRPSDDNQVDDLVDDGEEGTHPYICPVKFYLRKPFEKALTSTTADVKYVKELLANRKEVPAKEMLGLLSERGHPRDSAYQILGQAGADPKKLGRGRFVYCITGRTSPRTRRSIESVVDWVRGQLANGPVLGQLLLHKYLKSDWPDDEGESTKDQLWSASRKLGVKRQYIAKFGALLSRKKQIGGLPVFWRLPDQTEISDDEALRAIEGFRALKANQNTGDAPADAETPPAPTKPKKRGRPAGSVNKDIQKRKMEMLAAWDRGEYGKNKAKAADAHGFHRPDASKLINEYERRKA